MVDHKNQHFVPRVIMRLFSRDEEGKSINLYNIRSDRLIPDAPVKGQCARHYWYGEDGVLEGMLAKLEGIFAKYRDRVVAGSNTDHDRGELKLTMYFQHWRTARAAERFRHSWEQMNAATWGPKEPVPDDKRLVMSSMKFGMQSRDVVDDLKVRIVENRTTFDFIVGDDPAVMLNRFAVERLGDMAFGVSSSGLIMTMPLGPQHALLCYDGQVYTLDLDGGRLVLTKDEQVEAFNDIQMLASSENLYIRDIAQGQRVRARFLAIKDKIRPHSTLATFVPDGEDERAEHYRSGTTEEGRAVGGH